MRIRSIKPEFWRSDDVAALRIEDRLLFIGLWSYVDDSGIGIDSVVRICADLFAHDLSRDAPETLRRVTGGLQNLSERDLVTRYEVAGKGYLYITKWETHQRIEKPGKQRYPGPDQGKRVNSGDSPESPENPPESLPPGTGDQGNRGTVLSCASADAERDINAEFDAWWEAYPRKRGKGQAITSYRKARKHADADTLIEAVKAQTPFLTHKGMEFTPYPSTWLNGARWLDEVIEPMSVQESNSFFDRPFKVVTNE